MKYAFCLIVTMFVMVINTNEQVVIDGIPETHFRVKALLDNGYRVESEQLARRNLREANQGLAGDAEIASCLEDLARALNSLSKFEEAKKLLNQAMEIRKRSELRKDHFIIQNMEILISTNIMQSNTKEAERIARDAMEISSTFAGVDRSDHAELLELMALIHYRSNDIENSQKELHLALSILENIHGKSHPSLCSCLDQLAVIDITKSNFDKARLAARRSLKIRETLPKSERVNLATSYELLGMTEALSNHSEEALKYYANALFTRDETMNPNSISIENDLQYICGLSLKVGVPTAAKYKPNFVRYTSIIENKYGYASIENMLAYIEYKEFLNKIGDMEEYNLVNKKVEAINRVIDKK